MAKNTTTRKARKNNLPQPAPVAQRPQLPSISVDPEVLTDMMRRLLLELAEDLPNQTDPEIIDGARARRGRQYAVRIRDRMRRFAKVYNAAWHVRHVESSAQSYRDQKMQEFWRVCMQELNGCKDIEAFTYAVADALTAYRYGYPWEG